MLENQVTNAWINGRFENNRWETVEGVPFGSYHKWGNVGDVNSGYRKYLYLNHNDTHKFTWFNSATYLSRPFICSKPSLSHVEETHELINEEMSFGCKFKTANGFDCVFPSISVNKIPFMSCTTNNYNGKGWCSIDNSNSSFSTTIDLCSQQCIWGNYLII